MKKTVEVPTDEQTCLTAFVTTIEALGAPESIIAGGRLCRFFAVFELSTPSPPIYLRANILSRSASAPHASPVCSCVPVLCHAFHASCRNPAFLETKPGRKHEDRHVRQRRACGVQLRRNRLNLEVCRCSVLAKKPLVLSFKLELFVCTSHKLGCFLDWKAGSERAGGYLVFPTSY